MAVIPLIVSYAIAFLLEVAGVDIASLFFAIGFVGGMVTVIIIDNQEKGKE